MSGVEVHEGVPLMAGPSTGDGSSSKSRNALTCDDAIERIGITYFHIYSVIICGLANASDAVEMLAIGYIIPELKRAGVSVNSNGEGKELLCLSILPSLSVATTPSSCVKRRSVFWDACWRVLGWSVE